MGSDFKIKSEDLPLKCGMLQEAQKMLSLVMTDFGYPSSPISWPSVYLDLQCILFFLKR